jgi:tetratricopeptide (TPR) repeat protein
MLVACVFSFVRPSVAQEATADEKVEAKQEAAAQARAHYSKGQTLEAAGDADGAADEYLQALRKDPSAIGNNVYRLVRVVHRTKRVDELVKALEEIDVAALGQYYYVSNLYQYLMNFDEHHDASLKIFGLAWKAFPDNHLQLLQMVHHEKIWQRQEMFDYAREALVPNPGQVAANPWIGMLRIMSYDAQGKAHGIVTRLVVAAAAQNKLEDLAKQFASLLEQQPQWYGGQAIGAVLDVKQGNIDNARQRIVQLLDNKSAPMPVSARWLLSQELDGVDPLNDLSLRLLEDARAEVFQSQSQFSYSAARRLVRLYARASRKQDGRALIR